MKDLKLAAEKGYEKWYFEGVEYALRTTYPMDWTPDSAEFDEVVTRIERMDLPIDEKHEMMDGQLSKLVRENASEKEAIMDEMERLRVRLKEIEMEEKKIASVIVRLKEE